MISSDSYIKPMAGPGKMLCKDFILQAPTWEAFVSAMQTEALILSFEKFKNEFKHPYARLNITVVTDVPPPFSGDDE